MTAPIRRTIAVLSTVCVVGLSVAVPVLAAGRNNDGEDRGTPMPLWWAIVLFLVVPLAISFAISLIVLLPDWARRARRSTRGGYMDDPTLGDRLELDRGQRAAIGQ